MAKIEAGILGKTHGKVASVVAANWKGINYIKERVTPRNPRTPAQQAWRQNYAWANNFGQAFRNTFQKNIAEPFIAKQGLKLTWQMDWIRRNIGIINNNYTSTINLNILGMNRSTFGYNTDMEGNANVIRFQWNTDGDPTPLAINTLWACAAGVQNGRYEAYQTSTNLINGNRIEVPLIDLINGYVLLIYGGAICDTPGDMTTMTEMDWNIGYATSNKATNAMGWNAIINRLPNP
jgi:hypothetical protein